MDSVSNGSQGGGQSVYSPILVQTKALFDMIEEYKKSFSLDFFSDNGRFVILNYANQIFDMLNEPGEKRILTDQEVDELSRRLTTMQMVDSSIRQSRALKFITNQNDTDSQVVKFRQDAHKFNSKLQGCLQAHNLGIKTKEKADQVKIMCDVLTIKNQMINAVGIPISFQMEQFCQMLYRRAQDSRDNFICIEGPTGVGKSTFSLALLTTYASMTGLGWNWDTNLIINEKKEEVADRISKLDKFQVMQLDEAGNQANRRQWYDPLQQLLTNLTTRIRFHNLTICILWPDMKKIDPDLSSDRSVINVSINERGQALVKSFNRNTYAKSKIFTADAAKNRFVNNSAEANEMAKTYDMSIITEIPFYEIPELFWKEYENRKNQSLHLNDPRKPDTRRNQTKELVMKMLASGLTRRQVISRLGITKQRVSQIVNADARTYVDSNKHKGIVYENRNTTTENVKSNTTTDSIKDNSGVGDSIITDNKS